MSGRAISISKHAVWILLFTFGLGLEATAAESLKLNEDKSKIEFVGSKPDGDKHEGGFKKFSARTSDPGDDLSLTIKIDAESLWSDNPKLTSHLKNPDFFDVRKYPTITFESTRLKQQDDRVLIVGKMKMLDKTEELSVPVTIDDGTERLKIVADFLLDRTKWGMTYGEGKIDRDVKIQATLVFDR